MYNCFDGSQTDPTIKELKEEVCETYQKIRSLHNESLNGKKILSKDIEVFKISLEFYSKILGNKVKQIEKFSESLPEIF